MLLIDGFISRLDIEEERVSKLEDMSIETSQTGKEKKRSLKKTQEVNVQ